MRIELKLPRYGTEMTEATIRAWFKRPGDHFAAGERLYEVETEKVMAEVVAPVEGTLVRILTEPGDVTEVGQAVCEVETY